MIKKIKKILILVSLLFIFASNYIYSMASVGGLPIGNNTNNNVLSWGKNFYGIAEIIGVGVATIMLIALAIKYMVSSPSEKAEIKKHAIVYIVGAIFIFAASGILAIINAFMSSGF